MPRLQLFVAVAAYVITSFGRINAFPADSEGSPVIATYNAQNSTQCKLPPQPANGHYKLGGCRFPCQHLEGSVGAYLLYICDSGFTLIGYSRVTCNGVWTSPFPTCSKGNPIAKCSPLVDTSRLIECKLHEQTVDCNEPMAPGTNAMVTCNKSYTQVKELAEYKTVCQLDGRWSRNVISCIARCGEMNASTFTIESSIRGYHYWWYLASNNVSESSVNVPWHAGIYKKTEGKYLLICGGNIISESVIISAAHCFQNEVFSQYVDQRSFKLVVGKVYNDWNADEQNVQLPEIDEIILHPNFRGTATNYAHDIALVKLKNPLQITKSVQPICMDFNKNFEKFLLPGKLGVVAGWGGNQTKRYSEKVRKLTLPYVDFETCEKNVPTSFLPFITVDKFCAGYLNGTSLRPGDTGGGFASQFEDGRWYLMGIASIGVPGPNYSNSEIFTYTMFTKVSSHYDFIRS